MKKILHFLKHKSLNRLFKLLLIVAYFSAVSQNTFAQSPLCPSSPTLFGYEYVSSININGQVRQGDTGYNGPGYIDYSGSSITSLVAGNTYPVSVTVVTNSTWHEYVKIWFDFNGNQDLQDPGELIFDQNNSWFGTYTFSGNITVPTNAYNGNVFLRVIMVYAAVPQLCGNYDYGNTIDFKATISGGVTPRTLTVADAGTPGYIGSVVSSPSGINTASGFNSANFPDGSTVILTATNASGGTFVNWTGDATGTNTSTALNMNANKNVTANFAANIPTDPTSISPSANPICIGTSTLLTANGAQGTVYWYSGSCGGTSIGTGNSINVSPGITTSYFAKNFNNGLFSNGCALATINVNTAPVISCPSNITVNNTLGLCGANVTFPSASATGIPTPTITYSQASGSLFAKGTTIVTATATNSCGVSSCTFNVTVIDNEKPVITCIANQTIASCLEVIPDYTTSSIVSDNCGSGGVTVTQNPVAGTSIAPGETANVILTAKDASNNSASCSFTVLRPDITPVAMDDVASTCAGSSVTFNVLGNDSHPQGAALTISDNTTPSVGTLVKNPDNTFTYTSVTPSISPVTFTYTIKANDGVIPFSGNNHYYEWVPSNGITWQQARADAGTKTFNGMQGYLVTVTSAEEMSFVTSKLKGQGWMGASDLANEGVWRWVTGPEGLESGGLGRQFSDQYKNGNCSASTAPGINGNYANWSSGEPNDCGANIGQYSPTDPNRGGEHYAHFTANGAWNDYPNSVGGNITGYVVEYGGMETCTPVLTATATVTITVNPKPVLSAVIKSVTCPGGNDGAIDLTVSSGPVPFTFSWSNGAITQDVNNLTTGTYSVTVTNANGCSTLASFTVNQVDNVAPVAVAKNITVQLDQNGTVNITAAQVNNGSSDNCSITSLVLNKTSFSCSNLGANTVILTATDAGGNSNSATAVVTVQDNIAPSIVCPAPVTAYNTQIREETRVMNIPSGGSTNGWSPWVYNFTDPLPVGAKITGIDLTFTAVDQGWGGTGDYANLYVADTWIGNGQLLHSSTTHTTHFSGQIPAYNYGGNNTFKLYFTGYPGWVGFWQGGQMTIHYTTYDGCLALVELTSPTATDNCTTVTITNSQNGTSNASDWYPVGTTNVVWTAKDASGNSSTCIQAITVVDNIAPVVITKNITIQLDATGAAAITAADVNNGSSDACGIATMILDKTAFNCSNVGANTVTLTVTDIHGNIASGTSTVTVENHIAPVAIAQNITIQLDAAGAATITAADVNNGSSDACGIASLVLDKTTFDCSNVGVNTVTLTVTDVHGNVSTTTAMVTVEDHVAPVALAKNITIQLDATGVASIVPADVDNGSTDACGIQSLAVSQTAFSCSNFGVNTVTLTVTDNHGNVSTAIATVTIEDHVAPVAIAQNITIQLDAAGAATITAADVNNGSSDACGIASLVLDKTTFDCSNVGVNTVTLTVTDVHGNVSNTTAMVTVEDHVAPVALAKNITIQLDATGVASIVPADVDNGSTDACGIATLAVSKTAFDCSNVGVNTVTLTVTDVHGNVSTTTAMVTVEDHVAPVALAKNITIQLDATGVASIVPADVNNGSTDACGIQSLAVSQTAFDCSNAGANTVTLTVTDVHGNVSTTTAMVTVEDHVAPVALAKNITIQLDATGVASIVPADVNNGSTDACGIQSLAISQTAFSCSNFGINTVTLTVTDNHGNISTATATVTVEDHVAPVAIAQNITIQLDATGVASIVAADVNNGSNDACGIASMTLDKTTFDCSNVGVNTVTLTVTDVHGNVSTTTAVVTVEDHVAPVALAKNITIQLDATGVASIVAADIDNGSSDACGIQSLAVSQTAFDCSNVGANTVILTVTDVHGNVSTATAVVTVEDHVAPVAIAQNVTIQLNASGAASITAVQINNGSTDACGIASLVLDKTTFDCSNVGANTVILTVTDNHNNVSTVSATVTVQDNIAPKLTVPANIVRLNDAGVCGAVLNIGLAVATDNCSVASVTSNAPAFFPVGITTITWTAVDVNGNSTTGTQTVEITNNAPVISGLTVSPLVKLGDATVAAANHADNNLVSATWSWGDGSSTTGVIAGTHLSGNHFYSQTGLYDVTLTIMDACGKTDTEVYSYVVIYNPCDGFITGGGLISTTSGSYAGQPTLTDRSEYEFEAQYKKGDVVPSGEFQFQLKTSSFKVESSSLDWLMVNNDQAILKGSATVNGQSGYRFIASMIDGNIVVKNGTDYLRLIVWDNAGNVLYDNQSGNLDNARASNPIYEGQIVIHKSKKGNCYDYEEEVVDKAADVSSGDGTKSGSVSVALVPVQIEMTVYPNPVVDGTVNISIENFGNTKAKVDLTSLTGQSVYSIPSVTFAAGNAKIDFKQANLKSGNYLLRVSEIGGSRVGVKQIIVSSKN